MTFRCNKTKKYMLVIDYNNLHRPRYVKNLCLKCVNLNHTKKVLILIKDQT